MMDVKNLSTIGRPVDMKYTTNRIIMILMGLIFIITFFMEFFRESFLVKSLIFAVIYSLSVFLCWALGRELDPEYDYSAFIGIIFLFLPFFMTDGINLFFILWLLFSLRMINHTTGKPAGIVDIFFYLIITILFSLILYPFIAVLAAVAFVFDLWNAKRKTINILLIIVLFIIFLVSTFYGSGDVYNFVKLTNDQLIFSGISILFMFVVIATTTTMNTLCDTGDKKINARQVQTAQIFAVFTVLSFFFLYGTIGFSIVYIVLSSFLGISIYRVGIMIKKLLPSSS
jgi:hypothetical protein